MVDYGPMMVDVFFAKYVGWVMCFFASNMWDDDRQRLLLFRWLETSTVIREPFLAIIRNCWSLLAIPNNQQISR